MKINHSRRRVLALLAALALTVSLTACGGDNAATDGGKASASSAAASSTPTALTEQEYQDAVTKLGEEMSQIQEDANGIDATDVDAAKELLDSMKQPLQDFMNVTPPESYADAHEKMKSGCQAMIDYLDTAASMLGETDTTKLNEAATKMQEQMTTAINDLAEGSAMLVSTES